MGKKFRSTIYLLKVLLGLDEEWKKQFDIDATLEVENLKENFAQKGMYQSGKRERQISLLKMKKGQEKKDEARKRLLEGLKLIPPWLALLISIVSLIIALLKR